VALYTLGFIIGGLIVGVFVYYLLPSIRAKAQADALVAHRCPEPKVLTLDEELALLMASDGVVQNHDPIGGEDGHD